MNKNLILVITLFTLLAQTLVYSQNLTDEEREIIGSWKYVFTIPEKILFSDDAEGFSTAYNGTRMYKINEDKTLLDGVYENGNFTEDVSMISNIIWNITGNILSFSYKLSGIDTVFTDEWKIEFDADRTKVTGTLISTTLSDKSAWINIQKIYCVKL